jgi:hypothetical protein
MVILSVGGRFAKTKEPVSKPQKAKIFYHGDAETRENKSFSNKLNLCVAPTLNHWERGHPWVTAVKGF